NSACDFCWRNDMVHVVVAVEPLQHRSIRWARRDGADTNILLRFPQTVRECIQRVLGGRIDNIVAVAAAARAGVDKDGGALLLAQTRQQPSGELCWDVAVEFLVGAAVFVSR